MHGTVGLDDFDAECSRDVFDYIHESIECQLISYFDRVISLVDETLYPPSQDLPPPPKFNP